LPHGQLGSRRAAETLGFSLALTHPFLDGNKRAAHAAMEAFLLVNGFEFSLPSTNKNA